MESRRVLRVEREIKEVMANLLIHGLKVPLPGFASVVHVDVSGDLRTAKIFVRVAGSPQDHSIAEELLNEQKGSIQRELGNALKTKFCPVVRFVVGGAPAHQVDDVERMLANLRRPQYS